MITMMCGVEPGGAVGAGVTATVGVVERVGLGTGWVVGVAAELRRGVAVALGEEFCRLEELGALRSTRLSGGRVRRSVTPAASTTATRAAHATPGLSCENDI